jgi:hypothetical protein
MPTRMKKKKTIKKKGSKALIKKGAGLRASGLTDWNELVPQGNRFESPNKNARRPASLTPTHIVIHITGTNNLDEVKKTFLAPNSVSAHYLVAQTGELFQFVKDAGRAYHAGIDSNTRKLYQKGYARWSKYLKYFDWYKNYPADAVYLDGDGNPVWDKSEVVFVATSDGTAWPDFAYFRERWAALDTPVNFDIDTDPNNYSIGIECLSMGAKTNEKTAYSDEMYEALCSLLKNLSGKYGIPRTKGRIVGHEDVNPIGRFGWDPNAGFDWTVVHDG